MIDYGVTIKPNKFCPLEVQVQVYNYYCIMKLRCNTYIRIQGRHIYIIYVCIALHIRRTIKTDLDPATLLAPPSCVPEPTFVHQSLTIVLVVMGMGSKACIPYNFFNKFLPFIP